MSERKNFNIAYSLNKRMQDDAKLRNQTETEWINQAIAHALTCRDIVPNLRMQPLLTSIETTCVKCGETIPAFREIMYSSNVGALCTKCYLQRYGDKGRLINIMKDSELKEDIRVLTAELKEKTEEYALLDHKGKLEQLLTKHDETEKRTDDILRQVDQLLKLGESYFKEGYGDAELKSVLDRMKKVMDMIEGMTAKSNEQIEATEPLVRDLVDFDERYFERLKKRKLINQASAEYR